MKGLLVPENRMSSATHLYISTLVPPRASAVADPRSKFRGTSAPSAPTLDSSLFPDLLQQGRAEQGRVPHTAAVSTLPTPSHASRRG
ncbi:hypothetical protein E2C01_083915 [Portunus trituberculatus]|uniref:Uncharacterized protein n=1 Tax=Portunus trituberculatus TaxID=210409 RepID=A0A5B7J637_PORTR|nr:hypothetical protein [Portunus trituberculatus]